MRNAKVLCTHCNQLLSRSQANRHLKSWRVNRQARNREISASLDLIAASANGASLVAPALREASTKDATMDSLSDQPSAPTDAHGADISGLDGSDTQSTTVLNSRGLSPADPYDSSWDESSDRDEHEDENLNVCSLILDDNEDWDYDAEDNIYRALDTIQLGQNSRELHEYGIPPPFIPTPCNIDIILSSRSPGFSYRCGS